MKVAIKGSRAMGGLDGSNGERLQRTAGCCNRADFKAPVLDNFRAEIRQAG